MKLLFGDEMAQCLMSLAENLRIKSLYPIVAQGISNLSSSGKLKSP